MKHIKKKLMKNTEKIQVEWVGEADLSLDNSFGRIASEKNVSILFTLGIHEGGRTGWFEFYDAQTGGIDWYAEGMLWFDGKTLMDYDGVYDLPIEIVNKLDELGYDVEDFKS